MALQFALRRWQPINVTTEWLADALAEKISIIDWTVASQDVERSLNAAEKQSLKLWSKKFFLAKVAQLAATSA
jgi:hypothetical protein